MTLRKPLRHFSVHLTFLPLLLAGCGGGGGGGAHTPGLAASRVVFQSDRTGQPQIYLMNGDGSGQVPLTTVTNTPVASDAVQPAFNRDGSLIAFRAKRPADASFEIYVMNADGSNQHAVTHDAFDDAEPAFSRTGNVLVFKSTRNGQSDLFSLDLSAAGATAKQLTNDVAFEESPAFAPDGSVIFSSNRSGTFLLYSLQNGVTKALPRQGAESQFFPDVSASGQIAFVSDLSGNFDVYAMNADGTNRRRITQSDASEVDPVFSPNGSKIYYASLADGNYNLFVTSADGTGSAQRLTTSAGADRLPDVR